MMREHEADESQAVSYPVNVPRGTLAATSIHAPPQSGAPGRSRGHPVDEHLRPVSRPAAGPAVDFAALLLEALGLGEQVQANMIRCTALEDYISHRLMTGRHFQRRPLGEHAAGVVMGPVIRIDNQIGGSGMLL